MPGLYSSHGTTVFFNGVQIGYLTDYDIEASASSLVESTNVNSLVLGTGAGSRVLKNYDCVAVDPPKLSLALRGMPTNSPYDVGTLGLLEVYTQESVLTGQAVLVDWRHSGRTNAATTGSVTFQLNGF